MISLYVFQVESSEDLSEKVVTKFMYISEFVTLIMIYTNYIILLHVIYLLIPLLIINSKI